MSEQSMTRRQRREAELSGAGIRFVGMGVSGGEEGAQPVVLPPAVARQRIQDAAEFLRSA